MPTPNQRLGEYILIDRIGSGAFGEVWRASHHAWANQVVAIKIPTNPQYVRNLQREGIAVHALSHPNIVKAIAFDPYADPAYFVMEYVSGSSLRSLIQKGPMRPSHAVAVMKQVCAALHHAHGQGLVHRDIKPENILIDKAVETKGFAAGTVKLTDFGLGQVAAQSDHSIVLSQAQGEGKQIVGSVQYMAPEQLDGGEVDGRADLYSCGVVLFEMLTGHRPVGIEVPSDVNAAVPNALDDIFRRAFARRERRFATAMEFLHALNGLKTVPALQTAAVVSKHASKRRPLHVALLSLISAILLAIVVAMFWPRSVRPAAVVGTRAAIVPPGGPQVTISPSARAPKPAPRL